MVELDVSKGPIVAAQIFESIVAELVRAKDLELSVSLEINAQSAGFDRELVGIVGDNSETLRFKVNRFE